MEDAIGEIVKELEDGFINGQEDVWRWVDYNINEFNISQAPPNMAMMAKMKSQQQFNMLKQMHEKYLARNVPVSSAVAPDSEMED